MPTLADIERRADEAQTEELTVRLRDALEAAISAAEDVRYYGVRHDLDDLIGAMERVQRSVERSLMTREELT